MIKKILILLRRIFNRCFFLGSTDKLPPPLSKEDELKYLIEFQNGSNKAKEVLIEHNLRLVVFIAKKYESTGYDIEDLVSIGSIGLIKGINTYKIDKNIKLATYASRCIANEILMYVRKNKNRKGEISFEDALNYDAEGNELHLEDILGTDDNVVPDEIINKFDKLKLNEEITNLDERDKQIMIMRYGLFNTKEYTQKEVADLLGISQSYISRIEKKVISKLKISMDI